MFKKLTDIKGVGPKVLKKLYENNIFNTYDLILRTPINYETPNLKKEITHLEHDEVITILAEVISDVLVNHFTKVKMATFNVLSNNQIFKCLAFNQTYLEKSLKRDDQVIITGKYNFNKNEIVVNKVTSPKKYQSFNPIYNLKDINNKNYSNYVYNVFENNLVNIYEVMPENLINKYGLVKRKEAYFNVHFPKSNEDINNALKRLKYEEAYLFQKELSERINVSEKREPIDYNINEVKQLINSLDFELTADQKAVTNDLFLDFKKTESTFRLIQGDVGSGKTVVALIAILGMLSANKQVAFMAPTEMLAVQQYQYFKKYLPNYNVNLLTSKVKNQKDIKDKLLKNQINLIVGTHSLASEDVIFKELGLVIIDEQHKFGVNIRKQLANKGNANIIYLTATPIPRTLAITIFNQAKISSIKEKPKNRLKVITNYISDNHLDDVFNEIHTTINKNEKVFIVVPAIESEHTNYNILNTFELLKKYNLDNKTKVLHSKIKPLEQEEIINSFVNKETMILLATSMVEVGIDVSNATLMVVLSAEYFGLSQLHQLRGRVGRSNLASKFILVSSDTDKERLNILTKIDDGFVLSEYDLKLRGPGELIGFEQSGLMKFKYLDYIKDYQILKDMNYELSKKKNIML